MQEREITKGGGIRPALLTGAAGRSFAFPLVQTQQFWAGSVWISLTISHKCSSPWGSRLWGGMNSGSWEARMQELWHFLALKAANWVCGYLMDPSYVFRRENWLPLSLRSPGEAAGAAPWQSGSGGSFCCAGSVYVCYSMGKRGIFHNIYKFQ